MTLRRGFLTQKLAYQRTSSVLDLQNCIQKLPYKNFLVRGLDFEIYRPLKTTLCLVFVKLNTSLQLEGSTLASRAMSIGRRMPTNFHVPFTSCASKVKKARPLKPFPSPLSIKLTLMPRPIKIELFSVLAESSSRTTGKLAILLPLRS